MKWRKSTLTIRTTSDFFIGRWLKKPITFFVLEGCILPLYIEDWEDTAVLSLKYFAYFCFVFALKVSAENFLRIGHQLWRYQQQSYVPLSKLCFYLGPFTFCLNLIGNFALCTTRDHLCVSEKTTLVHEVLASSCRYYQMQIFKSYSWNIC